MRLRIFLRRLSALLIASAALSSIGVPLTAQTTPTREKIDLSRVGPGIGERVPDFSLQDQTGRTRTLPSVLGSKGAMLVFFRSADW